LKHCLSEFSDYFHYLDSVAIILDCYFFLLLVAGAILGIEVGLKFELTYLAFLRQVWAANRFPFHPDVMNESGL